MSPEVSIQKSQNTTTTTTRTYKEITAFLDQLQPMEYSQKSVDRMIQLDKLFGKISTKTDIILIGGTNGKSLSMHTAARLLHEEGYKTGIAYSSHILAYNERTFIDTQAISNKDLAIIANEIINETQAHNINATAFEIMTISSLIYFLKQKVDVILLEVGKGGMYDATSICNPKIAAITRIADDYEELENIDLNEISFEMLSIAKPGTIVISAEQSKIRLKKMKEWCKCHKVKWAMPIRRPAALPYVYEQLFGRTVSLGERFAQIYIQDIRKKFSPFLKGNLIASREGQRGRPTTLDKRNANINPIKSLKKFWVSEFTLLPGIFQVLDKETPKILLDNADNIDALDNTFLGMRLLNYQKEIKHLTVIIGLHEKVNAHEVLKRVRYLFKKVEGSVFFVPVSHKFPCHDTRNLAKQAKGLGITNAKPFISFTHALEESKTQSKENNLVAIIGSQDLISQYWEYMDVKKV